MAAQQTRLIDHLDSEVVKIYTEISVTTTTVANTVFSAYSAFASGPIGRAFSAVPKVLGVNAPRASTIVTVEVDADGITFYVRGLSDAVLADGTLLCSATLEGRLA